MGVDAVISFRPEDLTITTDQLEVLFENHVPGFLWIEESYSTPSWEPDADGFTTVDNLHRYYGPGYERGPCWVILSAIQLVRGVVNGEVRYGGDWSEPCEHLVFTDESLLELVNHWTADPLGGYRQRIRQRNYERSSS